MAGLTQLVDGNWIDPATVTGIFVFPAIDKEGCARPDVMKIQMGGTCLWVWFPARKDAIEERDRLATLVNRAFEA
jgi:hypothetical protein